MARVPVEEPLPPPKSLGIVLVIGGCGFLGRHVVDQLLNFPSEKDHAETSFSLGPNSGRYTLHYSPLSTRYPSYDQSTTKVHALDLKCTRNRFPGCTYHEADITDAEQLLDVFRKVKPDVVINTASPHWDAPRKILHKVNIEGTKTLIEVAGGARGSWGGVCKAFVHTSSSSVIHDTQSHLRNADERWPLVTKNEREYYSETKALAEYEVLKANGSDIFGGMLTAAVRPAGITGEGDMAGIAHGLCTTAISSPLWQLQIQLGEGNNLFDVTYVGNVALGLLLVAEALLVTHRRKSQGNADVLDHERVDGEAFIVTNDEPCYFWEIARFVFSRVGNELGGPDKLWVLPESLSSMVGNLCGAFGAITGKKTRINAQTVKYSLIDRYYSCEKIKRRCGYRPVVESEEGLARTVEWFLRIEKVRLGTTDTDKKIQ